jgi:hypothetical protein
MKRSQVIQQEYPSVSIGHLQGHHVIERECPSVYIGHLQGHHVKVKMSCAYRPSSWTPCNTTRISFRIYRPSSRTHLTRYECPSVSIGHMKGHYGIKVGCPSLSIGQLQGHHVIQQDCPSVSIGHLKWHNVIHILIVYMVSLTMADRPKHVGPFK